MKLLPLAVLIAMLTLVSGCAVKETTTEPTKKTSDSRNKQDCRRAIGSRIGKRCDA